MVLVQFGRNRDDHLAGLRTAASGIHFDEGETSAECLELVERSLDVIFSDVDSVSPTHGAEPALEVSDLDEPTVLFPCSVASIDNLRAHRFKIA